MNQKSDCKYLLAFITPDFKNHIFLAHNADIKSICYSDNPKLTGTTRIEYAKLYDDAEEAKKDIYMLRYYHRCFLNIKNAIVAIDIKKINRNQLYDSEMFINEYETDMFLET